MKKNFSKIYALYGASGASAGILPFAKKLCGNDSKIFYIDDDVSKKYYLDTKVLSLKKFLDLKANKKFVSITIGSPKIRKKISKILKINNIFDWSINPKNFIKMQNVKIGKGYVIHNNVTLTSNITIGSYFKAGIYSYVEHDCIIGDYVTLSPGAKCNGNVIIEDEVFVGSGAIILNGTPKNPIVIGKCSIIGAGAVVTKSVDPYSITAGNPARIIGTAKS
jgi:sugar O-acyltransferase (sialic acid O-acetyltransferase NeuD family)